ncbi:MAG: GYDIA family GHMP kinase [Chitinophagales bacterium]
MDVKKRRFYAHGKLLLSGEYVVLDGARALALPTIQGQILEVLDSDLPQPTLTWISHHPNKKVWLKIIFSLPDLEIIGEEDHRALRLQDILKSARKLNPGFLKEEKGYVVHTFLEFPLEWGLGSSSTLIASFAQWAGVDPYQLLELSFGGSGYDLAAAVADGPIFFQKRSGENLVEAAPFDPPFKEQLFFVYLNQKKDSREGIRLYKKRKMGKEAIDRISEISKAFTEAETLKAFENLIDEHEQIISDHLNLQFAKALYFSDYWGSIKSLGAWGGDFVLATSNKSELETINYFTEKGFKSIIPYKDIIFAASNQRG